MCSAGEAPGVHSAALSDSHSVDKARELGSRGLIGPDLAVHVALLGQIQHRAGHQGVIGVQDVVQGALEVLAHIGPLRSTGNRLDTLLYVE